MKLTAQDIKDKLNIDDVCAVVESLGGTRKGTSPVQQDGKVRTVRRGNGKERTVRCLPHCPARSRASGT